MAMVEYDSFWWSKYATKHTLNLSRIIHKIIHITSSRKNQFKKPQIYLSKKVLNKSEKNIFHKLQPEMEDSIVG
jgi:hypothetical protein